MAKLVDAADSKSAGAKHRAGSSPAPGTIGIPPMDLKPARTLHKISGPVDLGSVRKCLGNQRLAKS